jgi:hypothetical protein
MSEPLINNKIGGENQKVFLNQALLEGVQSINASQNLGLTPLSYAGIGNKALNYVPTTEQSNTFQINRLLLNNEPFLRYVTGSELANIYVLREQSDLNNNYCLLSGFFAEFSCSYSIGNLAECSTTFVAVGDAGKISTGNMYPSQVQDLSVIRTGNYTNTGGYLIPHIGSISLNISEYNTNRVQSFQISVTPVKVPVYNMGRKLPKRVDYMGAEINFNASFELGDYQPLRLRNIPQSGIVKNISISINDYSTSENICSFAFNNLNLMSETYEVSSNENIIVNQIYSTKIYGS